MKNVQKFVAEAQVGNLIAVDWDLRQFRVPNSSKGKVYDFSELGSYSIYASGSQTTLSALKKRLEPRENYLAYQSFTSLWIEFTLQASEEVQRITFFNSPALAGEPQRRKYAQEACEVAGMFEEILKGQEND
jgi:hypothetical protein